MSTAKAKLTVRIVKPIFDAFNARVDKACLRRDALISRALTIEIPRIQAEITSKNSSRARAYIQASLKALYEINGGSNLLTLALDSDTAAKLDEVCTEKNIPRDVLMNRLLLLLGISGNHLEMAFYPFVPPSWSAEHEVTGYDFNHAELTEVARETLETNTIFRYRVADVAAQVTRIQEEGQTFDSAFSPLARIEKIVNDPLLWYRIILKAYHEEMNSNEFPLDPQESTPFGHSFEDRTWHGLNCVMDDNWLDDIAKKSQTT